MAKDVFFENETEPIIDQLLEKYKLNETDEQALEKIGNGEYLNGGIILNVAKGVVMREINPTALPNYLKDQLKVSDAEATDLSKDILEKLVAGAEVEDVPEEAEPTEPETPKQNIQIEEADRMSVMPTAEPLPISETPTAEPRIPQSTPESASAPTETKPAPARKRALPKKEVFSPATPETTTPDPKVKMKKGPDSYREPIE
jgi:hypothetical protein